MQITNNKREFRFEGLFENGEKATLEYRWLKGSIVLMHTFVPDSLSGKGAGSGLVKYVFDYVREQNLKMIVYCPFAVKYLQSHPEYNDLVDEAYRK